MRNDLLSRIAFERLADTEKVPDDSFERLVLRKSVAPKSEAVLPTITNDSVVNAPCRMAPRLSGSIGELVEMNWYQASVPKMRTAPNGIASL